MAVAWTTITNAQVAAGAAVTTALMTALRDNPEGIAQRASGAPKIFGVAYDYQEFTTNGTWTKPSNAESGDKVIVQVVAGGEAGAQSTGSVDGGAGAYGGFKTFNDIDDLPSSVTIVIGAGGAGANQADGGDSEFDVNTSNTYIKADGGGQIGGFVTGPVGSQASFSYGLDEEHVGGVAGDGTTREGGSSIFGGGGGAHGIGTGTNRYGGGQSVYAGRGGQSEGPGGSNLVQDDVDGEFPGGGGAGVDTGHPNLTRRGNGGDGVIRVWCIKEG